VKLVLMNRTQTNYVATEEKIIPAGAPAQWLHFRLPPYRNLETSERQFYVWISSGGSPGVARIHGQQGSGYEVGLLYEPKPFVPPLFLDYPQLPNNVSYSFRADVQLREECARKRARCGGTSSLHTSPRHRGSRLDQSRFGGGFCLEAVSRRGTGSTRVALSWYQMLLPSLQIGSTW